MKLRSFLLISALLAMPALLVALTWEEWKMNQFTSDQRADEAVSGATADPDGDGMVNLHEYAFFGQTLSADTELPPTLELVSGVFALTYRERHNATDLSIRLQGSGTLMNWITYNMVVEADRVTFTGYDQVTLLDPITFNVGRRFLRLRVELLPLVEPRAPVQLGLQVITPTQWNLTWTDPNTTETGYAIERLLSTNVWERLATVSADSGHWQHATADYEASMTYRAVAIGADETEAASEPITLPDTDGDGLPDALELGASYAGVGGTYASYADQFSSTGSGVSDGWLAANGFNPATHDISGDTDNDGLSDEEEAKRGTDPNSEDSDGDDVLDANDGWPRHAWITTPPLPEIRYAVVPLRSLGLDAGAHVIQIDDASNVLASLDDEYVFWKASDATVETVPLLAFPNTSYGETSIPGLIQLGRNGHVTGWIVADAPSRTGAAIWQSGESTATPLTPVAAPGNPDWFPFAVNGAGHVVGVQYSNVWSEPLNPDMPIEETRWGGVDYSSTAWLGGSFIEDWQSGMAYIPTAINDAAIMGVYKTVIAENSNRVGIMVGNNFMDLGSMWGDDGSWNLIRTITSGTPVVALGTADTYPSYTAWWAHETGGAWTREALQVWDPVTQTSVEITDADVEINDRLEIIANPINPQNEATLTRNGIMRPLASFLPSGWSSPRPLDINHYGVILAEAMNTANGSGSQAEPVLLVPVELQVDTNHDGRIGGTETAPTITTPFRFWSNGDDDNPGATFFADYINSVIDGADDLTDFFPVFLDIKQLLVVLPPSTSIRYKLKQADGGLNFAYTNLTRANAFNYLTDTGSTYGPNADQAAAVATTQQITVAGVELPAAFLNRIKDQDQGVILLELRGMTAAPLRLVVEKDGTEIAEGAVNIATGEIEWESIYSNNLVEDFKVPAAYATYTTKDLKWLEGKRYFSDGDGPAATFHRTRINVKVKMAGAAGKSIKLKAFDVDDPTPTAWDESPAVIDTNDTNGPAGNDNNTGSSLFAGTFTTSTANTITTTLDGNGEATLEFITTQKSGANYRIAAVLSDTSGQLDALQVTNATAARYVTPDTKPVRNFSGVASPMLTVWRKLHVEVDSMGAIPTASHESQKNYAEGTVSSTHVSGQFAILYLDIAIPDSARFNDADCRIEILGRGSFTVFQLLSSNSIRIRAESSEEFNDLSGRQFKLYDDDYEIVALPMHTLAGDLLGRVKACYAPAFIEPVEAANPNPIISFKLNQSSNPLTLPNWENAKDGTSSSYYWHHLVTLGYQSTEDDDLDGEFIASGGGTPEENFTGGGINVADYSAIFIECIRELDIGVGPRNQSAQRQADFLNAVAVTMAHELGHAPGDESEDHDHNEDGFMKAGGADQINEGFSGKSILRFRETIDWHNN